MEQHKDSFTPSAPSVAPFTVPPAAADPKVGSAAPAALAASASNEDTIDLLDLFFMLRSHLLQILASAILGAILFGAYTSYFITPTYKATTQMYMVSSNSSSLLSMADLQLGNALASDYSSLIKNRAVLEPVIQSLGLHMSYSQLYGMVSISNPSDTHLLYITVTSTDPEQARDIANEIAQSSSYYLLNVMDVKPPNIAEEAITPTGKSYPNTKRNTMMGALLFGVVCVGIYVLLYLLDDTVHSSEDLERYFKLRPLAAIPEVDLDGSPSGAKHKKGIRFKFPKTARTTKESKL